MRARLLLVCLLVSAGCDADSQAGPTAPLDDRFTLPVGQSVLVEGTATRVTFLGVSGDSRCPADAICIHAGDATIHVRATSDSAQRTYELHTALAGGASATHGDLRIMLLELQPYPFSASPIGPSDYRVTLRVVREP